MSRNPPQSTRTAGQQTQTTDPDQAMAEDAQEGYASSTPTSSLTWIAWFCSLPGHEYFCEVTEDFIEDDFNLTGLSAMVPFWKEAMEMVLDVEPEDTHKIPDVSIVEASAELLYGLVHQRYILTRPGLQSMAEKYENGVFGSCLRVFCTSTRLIPCGRSDMPGFDTVKLFCPNCNDIYTPSSSRFSGVDGAFFGTTFAHLFFHTYREYSPAPFIPTRRPNVSPGAVASSNSPINPNQYGGQRRPETRVYVPKIYGFKISERAKSGPRMGWLRLRPTGYEELDMVDSRGRWIGEERSSDEEDKEPPGPERRGKFDEDDDRDENIEDEDEEEEEDQNDVPTQPPWQPQSGPSAGPGAGRRPVGGRTRTGNAVQHKSNGFGVDYDSASESEAEEELETPPEDNGLSGNERRGRPKELAAVKLANLMGLDVSQMFAPLKGSRFEPLKPMAQSEFVEGAMVHNPVS